MTFSKILKSFSLGVALILMLSFAVLGQQSRSNVKYKNPYVEGLYYVESSDNSDERELVITFDGKPIPPKSNDPEAPTIPGFYLSRSNRVAFQKVEVSGKKFILRLVQSAVSVTSFAELSAKKLTQTLTQRNCYRLSKAL